MARKPARISDAEQQLLQLLWDESPLGAVELAARAPADRDWSLTTVKTMLSRLVAKGVLGAEPDGRRFLYSPLVAQLAEEGQLSKDDLEELEALVRSLKS